MTAATKGFFHRARICVLAIAIMTGASAQATAAPKLHNGKLIPPIPPTQVLECNLPLVPSSESFTEFATCISGQLAAVSKSASSELQERLDSIIPPQVDQCLATAGTSFSQSLQAAKGNPAGFAQKHMTDRLNVMQNGASVALNLNLNTPMSASARRQHFEDVLLTQIDNDPLAACVFNVSSTARNQLISGAGAIAQSLQNQMNGWYQTHFEGQIRNAVRAEISNAINQLKAQSSRVSNQLPARAARANQGRAAMPAQRPTRPAQRAPRTRNIVADAVPEEISLMAKGLVYERLLDSRRLNRLTSDINRLAERGASGVSARDRARLQTQLSNSGVLADELAVELGIRVLRQYGHYAIEKAGEPLMELAFEYIRGYKTTGGEALDVPCSTPSVPGGAVCGLAWWAVNIALDFAWWQLELATADAMHASFDLMVDQHHANLRANGTPYQQLAANPDFGPLASLLPSEEELINVALPDIRAATTAFRDYQESVSGLVGSTQSQNLRPGR